MFANFPPSENSFSQQVRMVLETKSQIFSPDEILRKCSSVQWSPHTAMECSNNELKTAAQSYFRAQLKANYELWIANDSQCGALILLIWNFVFIQICPFFKDLQDMQIKIDFFLSVLKTQMALCGSWKTLTDKNKSSKSYRKMNCQSDLQTFKLRTDQSISSYKCINI